MVPRRITDLLKGTRRMSAFNPNTSVTTGKITSTQSLYRPKYLHPWQSLGREVVRALPDVHSRGKSIFQLAAGLDHKAVGSLIIRLIKETSAPWDEVQSKTEPKEGEFDVARHLEFPTHMLGVNDNDYVMRVSKECPVIGVAVNPSIMPPDILMRVMSTATEDMFEQIELIGDLENEKGGAIVMVFVSMLLAHVYTKMLRSGYSSAVISSHGVSSFCMVALCHATEGQQGVLLHSTLAAGSSGRGSE